MAYTRQWKSKDEYARDKIAYIEQKLVYWYGRMSEMDPNFRPNFIPNEPIKVKAKVIRNEIEEK